MNRISKKSIPFIALLALAIVIGYSNCKVSQIGTSSNDSDSPSSTNYTSIGNPPRPIRPQKLVDSICGLISSCHSDASSESCASALAAQPNLPIRFGYVVEQSPTFTLLYNQEVAGHLTLNQTSFDNCLNDLAKLDCSNPDVKNSFVEGLPDPYQNVDKIVLNSAASCAGGLHSSLYFRAPVTVPIVGEVFSLRSLGSRSHGLVVATVEGNISTWSLNSPDSLVQTTMETVDANNGLILSEDFDGDLNPEIVLLPEQSTSGYLWTYDVKTLSKIKPSRFSIPPSRWFSGIITGLDHGFEKRLLISNLQTLREFGYEHETLVYKGEPRLVPPPKVMFLAKITGGYFMDLIYSSLGTNGLYFTPALNTKGTLDSQPILLGELNSSVPKLSSNSHNFVSADFTGDSVSDLVFLDSNFRLFHAKGKSPTSQMANSSQFEDPQLVFNLKGPAELFPVDANKDQFVDLLIADSDSKLIGVALGLGDGKFDGPFMTQALVHMNQIVLNDLNKDGRSDLVFGNKNQKSFSIYFGK